MFQTNPTFLSVLIAVAVVVVAYLYFRIRNTGPLIYKLVFGLIIGGALGNLLDRAHNGGVVVDFISFRIPQIGFYFPVFNIADACISVGVCLLFLLIVWSSFRNPEEATHQQSATADSTSQSGTLRTREQDV